MSHLQANLENLLRPSERVLVTLPCRIRHAGLNFVKCEAALVAHGSGIDEENALFIFNRSSRHPLQILHLIPINTNFKHALLQTPPSPSTSFFHQSAPPYITLNLNYLGEKYELKIASSHSIIVRNLVGELRRVTEMIYNSNAPSSFRHSWLGLYPVRAEDEPDAAETPGVSASTAATSATSLDTPLPSSIGTSVSTSSFATSTTNTTESFFSINHHHLSDTEGNPNPYASNFSRTDFLRKRLFAKEDKWSTRIPLRIRLATYNVNDKLPPAGTSELAPLVGEGEDDLLVFGFQEVDLRSQAMLISLGTNRAEAWEAALFKGLGDRAGDYEKLVVSQYVGVLTIVLVRKTLRSAISRVETCERGIGLLGFGGNKAGVAIRIKVHDHTLTFVNSHLAAFATALERRRTDYTTLLGGLSFPRPQYDSALAYEEFLPDQKDKPLALKDSNALFWLGDLNYRIEMEDEKLAALVKWKRWEPILEQDQLRSDIASSKSFAEFQEAAIDFPPTFKYVIGSTTLDTRRPPAYTDRILYFAPAPANTQTQTHTATPLAPPTPSTPMSPPPLLPTPSVSTSLRPLSVTKVDMSKYSSHEILWSDHRPVSASAMVDVRVVDEEKRKAELSLVQGELDKLEEEWAPSLSVESQELDFGEIKYRSPVVKDLTLRNRGRVPAMFSFRAPPGRPICKPFIWPFPSSGTIPQGGELKLSISIYVDERWAERLTLGEEDMNGVRGLIELDTASIEKGRRNLRRDIHSGGTVRSSRADVLVLQVNGGKDTFITLQGTFAPSIIGLPLSVLTKLPESILSMSLADRKRLLHAAPASAVEEEMKAVSLDDDDVPVAAPSEKGPGPRNADTLEVAAPRETAEEVSDTAPSSLPAKEEDPELSTPAGSAVLTDSVGDETQALNDDTPAAPTTALDTEGNKEAFAPESASSTSTQPAPSDDSPKQVSLPAAAPSQAQKKTPDNVARPARVIWRLLEYLMEHGAGVEGLWSEEVDLETILRVIEILDTAAPLSSDHESSSGASNAIAIAQTLLHILTALPTPLVPIHCQTMCVEAQERDAAFAVLEGVEGVHTNVLIGLMSVVRLCVGDTGSSNSILRKLGPAVFGQRGGIKEDDENKFIKLLLAG